MWRLWAKAIGEKHGKTDSESDKIAFIRTIIVYKIAFIRTIIVLSYLITNCFIIAGVIRHW